MWLRRCKGFSASSSDADVCWCRKSRRDHEADLLRVFDAKDRKRKRARPVGRSRLPTVSEVDDDDQQALSRAGSDRFVGQSSMEVSQSGSKAVINGTVPKSAETRDGSEVNGGIKSGVNSGANSGANSASMIPSVSRGGRIKTAMTSLRRTFTRSSSNATAAASAVPVTFPDRASWLRDGTLAISASTALKIQFFDEANQKLEKFVFGPQLIRRIRGDEKVMALKYLAYYLRDVWKLPPPSLVLRIVDSGTWLSTSAKMRLRKILREAILSTPTMWIICAATSTPAAQVVGQVLQGINQEFNTVEDTCFNKPVVCIGVGVWDRVDEVG